MTPKPQTQAAVTGARRGVPWLIVGDPLAYRDQALLPYLPLLTLFVSCHPLVAFGKVQVPKIDINKLQNAQLLKIFSRQPSSPN